MRIQFNINKPKGFTLVEAIVSMGILAISMIAYLAVSQFSNQSMVFQKSLNSVNDLTTEIKIALDSRVGCNANFKTLQSPKGKPLGTAVTIYETNSDGSRGRTLADPGMELDKLITISDVRLKHKADIGADDQLLTLTIIADKRNDSAGARSSVFTIPIFTSVDATGKILSCTSGLQSKGYTEVNNMICDLSSNGLQTYDPATGKCTPRTDLTCYAGDANKASCPTGAAVYCKGMGYDPGAAIIPKRTYGNGATRTAPDFIYETSGRDCTCYYATEIAVLPGTVCTVCCKGNY